MKKNLFVGLLMLASLTAQAQNEITIDGKLTNVKDGLVVTLFRTDGRVGTTIATDTIENDQFHFKVKPENELDRLDLFVRSEEFPSMSRKLFATPNTHIEVTGKDNLIYTWEVKSNVKEQQEFDHYLYAVKDLWNEYQKKAAEMSACWGVLDSSTATEEEKKAAKEKMSLIYNQTEEIQLDIHAKEIVLMKEMPVTFVWLDKMYGLSMGVRYNSNYPLKDEALALYQRMTDADKNTELGKQITVNMFPPDVVKIGDDMADADLYDLEGNLHHLAELKGKYLLLDFWSSGCGPCIMALPEMGELQEKYADKLTVVSLSSDTEKRWKAASDQHKMTWQNWSDKKQTGGLYAKYGVNGIPHYVLISPEGKMIDTWSGYGKGSLMRQLRSYMHPKPAMSVGTENGVLWVNYPDVQLNKTGGSLEIKRVERTADATTVYFKAYYTPRYWIKIGNDAVLKTSADRQFKVLKADGITLDTEFYMPESGETEFSLTFEPLPLDAETFSFKEGNWLIKDVRLK